jgi:anti-repressor protein
MIKEFEHTAYGKIRTVYLENEPYYNLKDLCRLFEIKSITDIRPKLRDSQIKTVPVDTDRGIQNMFFVNAENLSTIFFQSKRKDADIILNWLYRTVLPELIKFGAYNISEYKDSSKVIELLDSFQELKVRNSVLETNLLLNSPKLKAMDQLFGTSSCVDLDMVHEIIKYKGITKDILLKILRATHVLDESNIPFQDFCDRKMFRVVEAKVVTGGSTYRSVKTFVYRSGINFIERILKEYDGHKHRRQEK